ncbi:redoxin domain-containing protein [Mucilaginibacter terrigena]|uniref:Redoxin domain-containing protein n=1 Tax=Mucilaginibacter terrigena TaxID=2492395 RepID=A0A4Q5LI98_9SPHI|nr:thioredoxin-like domain-containing protein [Mucilaginibacter terrigena]RYU87890.1 redoxin domain-containing protein [Mucilaginibacter terrigena]
MKYCCYIIASCVLLIACNNAPKFELTFKSADIKNGTITLNQVNQTLFTQAITNGNAVINNPITSPGYYTVSVIDSDKPLSAKKSFEVYLENGSYSIELNTNNRREYPNITSASKTQQQLSAYYKIENRIAGRLNHTIDSLLTFLDSRAARGLSKKEHSAFINKTRAMQTKRRKLEPEVLNAYVTQYPDNIVAAHIMARQYLDEHPADYNKIFGKLTDEAKKTPDGQKIADKLNVLIQLLPGSVAPDITGNTPDGKSFNKRSVNAKVILVEFWISGSRLSQMNHSKILNGLIIGDSDKKNFAIISVSTDTDPEVWKRAIKQSNLNWPQVADLKGDYSPNVANWKIAAVPTYFLVDGNWRIIKPNIDIIDVDQEVHDYLKNAK